MSYVYEVGERFGKLEVVGDKEPVLMWGKINHAYPCRCDCGKAVHVRPSQLASNGKKNCGCSKGFRKDSKAQSLKIGDRFGKLEVIADCVMEEQSDGRRRASYLCRCDCGVEKVMTADRLISGGFNSCGTCVYEKHGLSHTGLYSKWTSMKGRCQNVKNCNYKRYGAKGVKVCQEWIDSFAAFHEWSMANGFRPELTIERKDPAGNYEPDNCTWITSLDQQKNKRNTIHVTYKGETKCLKDWSRDARCQVGYACLHKRLQRKWPFEAALLR